ncbi:coiled-coil domain-containing protein 134-like [Oppia nitens]|uniref:coiled-coil domain-containing protein 134-like n=1 Tax=Oppia nitens TaxID=1686743 RepID=UPI0023D9A89D|nr:coiled-coil domain-containing protein 134-like [Oppia nitens]
MQSSKVLILLLNAIHLVIASHAGDQVVDQSYGQQESDKHIIGSKEEFRILLKQKRSQQLAAIKTLNSFGRYEQKYTMVDNIFSKLFEVQQNAKQTIENSSYVLGLDLPTDGHQLESLSQIIENCAFFGDIVLRLPDISHRVLTTHHEYQVLYRWCISFAIASDLCDKNTLKMFDLLAQELSLEPKDDSYVNPYKKSNKAKSRLNSDIPIERTNGDNNNKKSAKRIQKVTKRGPRLSKSKTEL